MFFSSMNKKFKLADKTYDIINIDGCFLSQERSLNKHGSQLKKHIPTTDWL